MAVNPADCRARLAALAGKDPFLTQTDHRPALDQALSRTDEAVRAALAEAGRRIEERGLQMNQELVETAGHLRKAAEQLAEEFSTALTNRPLSAESAARLARSIEGRILWLYDRVRARLEASLRRIAPKGRPYGDILQTIAAAWSGSGRELPEELVLILDRQQEHQAAGRSVWQMEGEHLLDQACAGHGFWASRLAFLRLRAQLKRRYRVLRCEPWETLQRHQPIPLQAEPPPALQACQRAYEEVGRAFADLWRNLRFSLETAAEDCNRLATELAKEEPEADAAQHLQETARLVAETLDRSAGQLPTITAPLKDSWHTLLSDLDDNRAEILALIPRDLQRELSWREKAVHIRRRLARSWRRWYEQGRRKSEKPRQALFGRLAKAAAFGRWLLGRSASSCGREETLQKLSDLPTPEEIVARAANLPPVCRRLFTIGALKNREFLVGKEQHLETLRDLFRRWQEGRLCSVAMVGPNGSGKTSLVNCFHSELGNQITVRRLEIDTRLHGERQLIELCARWFELAAVPAGLDELEEQLRQLPPAVVVVENIHRLLLRTPGGLDSARAFLRLVLASRRRLLWVITCRKYPWQRMQHLLHIDRYFTHQLQTLFGTQGEMRDALLLRLQTSSYPVQFLPGNDNGKATKKNGHSQEALQERFFTNLFVASRGNMQAALYYWLLCLDYDSSQESLTVRPLDKLDYSSLRSLDRQQFYTLAEIIAHGELTAAEHAAIFACDTLRSAMLLDHLVQLNLLEATPGDKAAGLYQLNPLFFAPATAILEGRNILQ